MEKKYWKSSGIFQHGKVGTMSMCTNAYMMVPHNMIMNVRIVMSRKTGKRLEVTKTI